ncbi:unnamed protein product [Withania somnifera]
MNVAVLLIAIAIAIAIVSASALQSGADDSFDVRQRLSTVSRYVIVKVTSDDSSMPSQNLDQCTPIHLNLVAQHGTRAPTKKRTRELEAFAARLEVLVHDVKVQKQSLDKIPARLMGWNSPWKGKRTGGELISEGEYELYHLGIRVREQFPNLFSEEYHPVIYPIKATQVPRASASAVAFGMGLFSGKGKLGSGGHRAFSVTSECRSSDIVLRFHDCCQSYKDYRKSQELTVKKLKEPMLDEITHELVRRYGLNFTKRDVSSLWFLCKQEASLLNITNQACSLFSPAESRHYNTPPKTRNWRGSIVAPFAGNNMLVLYSCASNNSSKYVVKVLHNERPIPIPGCNGLNFCPFEVFKERIVAPHLKHDYNTLCNVDVEQENTVSAPSMFSQMFG